MKRPLAAVVLAALLLAGCLGDEPEMPVQTEAERAAAEEKALADAVANQTDPADSETNATLGAMPHLHDYWQGRERVTVLEQDVDIDAPTAAFWTLFTTYLLKEPIAGGAFLELPEGQLVYEGTGQLDVTVSWSDATVSGMRLAYRSPDSGEVGEWNALENAQTLSIPVTPEMTDMPHTKQSRWFFILGAAGTPSVAVGKVHVKMDIVKMRDIALFPGHPDLWQGAEELELLQASGVSRSQQGPQTFLTRMLDPLSTPEDVVGGGKIVPMETDHLVVAVTVKAVNPEVEIDHMHVWYRAADDFANDFHEMENDEVAVSDDRLTWTWRIPVEMDMTDNPYGETSDWAFRVTAGYVNPIPGAPPCDDGCYNVELQYDLVVTAMKGAHEMG